MVLPALDPEHVRRFRDDLAAVGADGCALGVAVSGGPDSLALLLLAAAACSYEVRAATVDHGLRAQSPAEAEFVASLCARLGIGHHVLKVSVGPGASVQARAREARYAALARWQSDEKLDLVLTAHHEDDQAETLMMRLLRGSGVAGLAGIRPISRVAGAAIARPLLGWRRTELAGIVAAAGLAAVDDPSNRDPAYDRSRIRLRLAQSPWIDVGALARSAAALAEAEEALEAIADRLARERIARDGAAFLLAPQDLPDELLRRLVLRCLRLIDPGAAPRGAQVAAVIETLRGGGAATLAGIKCVGGARFRFEKAPPRGKNKGPDPKARR
jgi:tRNA(Ile)-lysidine synthase